jgi:hypothetical protein
MMVNPEYMILPGDARGLLLGFTEDKFIGYISLMPGNEIYISAIWSVHPGKGNFKDLVNSILSDGYTVKIPNPFPNMQEIAAHLGFTFTYEEDEMTGELVEVWVKKPERNIIHTPIKPAGLVEDQCNRENTGNI